MKKLQLLFILSVLSTLTANAQTSWQPLGPSDSDTNSTGFSAGEVNNTNIAIDGSGVPYVVYEDGANGSKATVMKFDGSNWLPVGSAGFSAGTANYPGIAIDGSGVPYVVYVDGANSNKATVKKFDGSNWVTVGSAGFSGQQQVTGTVIAIDGSGVPYVAFSRVIVLNYVVGTLSVMKFDGSNWVSVGNAGFSAGQANNISIAIDGSGVPYVVYQDDAVGADSAKATVMKYYDSTWVAVGSAGFSAGEAENTNIAIDGNGVPYVVAVESGGAYAFALNTLTTNVQTGWQPVGPSDSGTKPLVFSDASVSFTNLGINGSGVPYMVYSDAGDNGKATVMKFDGSSWLPVGSAGFSAGQANYTGIAIDGSGVPYVVYQDEANSYKATVMKYYDSTWVAVGSAGFSAGEVLSTNIAIDGSGVPYVVYTDKYGGSLKATVMKFDGNKWVPVGSVRFSAGEADDPGIAIDRSGVPYVVYGDYANLYKATVMKFDGSNWVPVGSAGFSPKQVSYSSIAIDGSGAPYVVYADNANSNKATVMKFDGSNWRPLGSAGFSVDEVAYTRIAIDSSGVPYVVYQDFGNSNKTTVMKYYDSTWVAVGSVGFSAGQANYTGIAIDGSGVPYVVAAENGAYVFKFVGTPVVRNTITATACGSYVWGAATYTASGSYTQTVTGASGNTVTTLNLTVNALSSLSITASSVSICNGNTAVLTAGGAATYSLNGTPFTSTISVSPSSSTTYTISCIDANGCFSSTTTAISVNALPSLSITASSASICSGSTAILTAGGAATYSLNGTPFTSTISVSPSSSTTYTISGRDANGCVSSTTQAISVNALPIVTASTPTDTICLGSSVTLTATGAASYHWSNGATSSSIDVIPTSTGRYIVTGTAVNKCTNRDTVNVVVNTLPYVSLGAAKTICYGTNSTIGVTTVTNVAYSWLPVTNLSAANISSVIASPKSDATYSLVATNTLTGCTNRSSINIVVNPLPATNAGADVTICAGNTITLTATGAASYHWSNGATSSSINFIPTSTGRYIVTGTAVNNCTNRDTVNVVVNTLPNVSLGAAKTICYGVNSTIGVTTVTNVAYSWLPVTNLSATNISSVIASPKSDATYSLVATNTLTGCTNRSSINIVVNPLPATNAGADVTICAGNTITLTATGAASYHWSNGATSSSINVIPTSTGRYIVTGTAVNNCTNRDTVNVVVNTLPNVSLGAAKTICYGVNSTIGVTTVTNVAYSWLPITNLSATNISSVIASPKSDATYSLVATDTLTGCTNRSLINIVVNPLPIANAGADVTICSGDTANIGAAAEMGLTYLWAQTNVTNRTTSQTRAFPTGTYLFRLTATNTTTKCLSYPDTVRVLVNALPLANAGRDVTIASGSRAVIGSAAIAGNSYLWSADSLTTISNTTAATTTVTPTATSIYTLTVTNNNTGCIKKDDVLITVTAASRANGSAEDNTTQPILLNATSGVNDIALYPNPASDNVTIQMNGTHSQGCITVKTIEGVTINTLPFNATDTQLTLNVSNLTSGSYVVTVQSNELNKELKLVIIK